jgi:hypothetical protein
MGPSYFDIHAGSGEAITKLVLSDGLPNLCCFETDNYSAIPATVPAPIVGAGLPGMPGRRWPSRLVATATTIHLN